MGVGWTRGSVLHERVRYLHWQHKFPSCFERYCSCLTLNVKTTLYSCCIMLFFAFVSGRMSRFSYRWKRVSLGQPAYVRLSSFLHMSPRLLHQQHGWQRALLPGLDQWRQRHHHVSRWWIVESWAWTVPRCECTFKDYKRKHWNWTYGQFLS